ncbi:MAG: Ivy family c-type lysozyme inhibitor [Caldimonas sp.]
MSARMSRVVLGTALCIVAASAWSAGWSSDEVARYGGLYSTDCSNPSAPRLRAEAGSLSVEVGGRRMTGKNVEISVAPLGNQQPEPGQEIVMLMSEVRGSHELSFWVHRQASGQFVQLEADPAVTGALGKALVARRFVDCDAGRNARVASAARAAIRAATVAAPPTQRGESRFRAAYLQALGPSARNEEWLVSQVGRPTDATTVTIAGTPYRQLTGCKPHDCGDNNALVLFAPQTGTVYGKVLVRGVPRLIGAPPPELARELDRLWRAEWRQGR